MSRIDVDEYISRSSICRYHIGVILLINLCFVADGYDLNVFGAVLPVLTRTWHISNTEAGLLGSATFFGMLIGAMVAGTVSDRIGRKPSLIVGVSLFSLATVASAFSPGPAMFASCRVLAGAGIGGLFAVAAALARELAPRRWASSFTIWIMCGANLGGVVAVLVARQIIETAGWRPVVFTSALFLVLIPFLMLWLPESPNMQVRKGLARKALRTLQRIPSELGPIDPVTDELYAPETGIARAPLAQVFTKSLRVRTILLGLIFACCLIPYYGVQTWLPSLLVASGRSLTSSLTMTVCLLMGGLVVNILNGWIVARLGLTRVFVANYILSVAAIFALGFASGSVTVAVLAFIAGGVVVNASVTENAFAAGAYPTAVRGAGLGWCLGIARIGAMAAPYIGGVVLDAHIGTFPAYVAYALPGAIAAVAAVAVVINIRRHADAPDVLPHADAPAILRAP
jgi:AAHS family benzoate transporter-like MFS transporter